MLEISFSKLPEADRAAMSYTYDISPKDGAIRLPFVGSVKIVGLTLAEIEIEIAKAYKNQFPNLEVTVV